VTTASDLRTLVTVQQRVTGTDSVGQQSDSWVQLVQVRAHVRHVSGSESAKADTSLSTVRASARVRRRGDITAAMRLLIGGMAYDIRAVVPVEDGRVWMDLVCEAVS